MTASDAIGDDQTRQGSGHPAPDGGSGTGAEREPPGGSLRPPVDPGVMEARKAAREALESLANKPNESMPEPPNSARDRKVSTSGVKPAEPAPPLSSTADAMSDKFLKVAVAYAAQENIDQRNVVLRPGIVFNARI
jgi:hypothetical protein